MNQTLVINGVIINNEEDINDQRVQKFINQLNDYMTDERTESPDGVAPKTLQNIIIYMCRSLLLGKTYDTIRNIVINAICYLNGRYESLNKPLIIKNVMISNNDDLMDINNQSVQELINELTDYIIQQRLPDYIDYELLQTMIITCNLPLPDVGDFYHDDTVYHDNIINIIAIAILHLHDDMQEQIAESFGVISVQEQIVESLGDGSNLPPVDFSFSDVETSESESNDEPGCWCHHCDLL
jgi:hypothetical protein